jgi:CBS domain-containing protein
MAEVKVRDVMTHLVVTLYPSDSILEAARRLARNNVSGAPVVEGGKVIGMVSESDLIRAAMPPHETRRPVSVLDMLVLLNTARAGQHDHGKRVEDIMTPIVVDISPDASVWEAAALMDHKGIKRLPVIDGEGYLIGVISRADVVKAMAKTDDQIAAEALDTVAVLGQDCFDELDIDVKDGVVRVAGLVDRKSTKRLALKLVARSPGVIEVIDKLRFKIDDERRIRPVKPDQRYNWVDDPARGALR